jgi:hypothetical protein
MGEDEAEMEELPPLRPSQSAAPQGPQKSNLPVPLNHPVAKGAQAKRKGPGVMQALRKQIGSVSAASAGFGKKLSSLLKPVKKPKAQPSTRPAAKQAPQRPAPQQAQAARDAQPMRSRPPQAEAMGVDTAALPPRQSAPGAASRPQAPSMPPRPQGQPEMAGDDFLNRRRRV